MYAGGCGVQFWFCLKRGVNSAPVLRGVAGVAASFRPPDRTSRNSEFALSCTKISGLHPKSSRFGSGLGGPTATQTYPDLRHQKENPLCKVRFFRRSPDQALPPHEFTHMHKHTITDRSDETFPGFNTNKYTWNQQQQQQTAATAAAIQ